MFLDPIIGGTKKGIIYHPLGSDKLCSAKHAEAIKDHENSTNIFQSIILECLRNTGEHPTAIACSAKAREILQKSSADYLD